MDDNLSNREQEEIFRKWLREYGVSILVAIILGLGINYGYRYYKQYQLKKSIAASVLYDNLALAVYNNKKDEVTPLARKLRLNYASTPYASFGSILEVKSFVMNQDYGQAISALDWDVQHSGLAGVKQLARIRIARIWLQLGKPNKALEELKTIDEQSFLPLIDLVRGDAYLAKGKQKQARDLYLKSKQAFALMGFNDSIISLKLDQLTR